MLLFYSFEFKNLRNLYY